MTTATQDKNDAETIRYLRDRRYTQRDIADAMGKHTTQIFRIAQRHGIEFDGTQRYSPTETGVYQLDIPIYEWRRIGEAMREWCDTFGDYHQAESFVAQMWGIPPEAIRLWVTGEHHRLD